jgi:hypothetical protein
MADSTLSDRIALAACPDRSSGAGHCETPCDGCRRDSAAVAHEIADWLRERHGGASTTADLLDGVGCHQPDTEQIIRKLRSAEQLLNQGQTVADVCRALERKRTQDPRMWPPIDPGQEAAAHAVGRDLRRPDT